MIHMLDGTTIVRLKMSNGSMTQRKKSGRKILLPVLGVYPPRPSVAGIQKWRFPGAVHTTIQLRRLEGTGCAPIFEDIQAAVKQRLSCSPKVFWHAWRKDILRISQEWRISTKELVRQAHFKAAAGRQQFRVLVDTGAKIPLVFRHGLFPRRVLRKACFPVNFTTADGQLMPGGTHGLFLEIL